MARFRWTEEAKRKVYSLSRMGFTYAEIAPRLETTANAIQRMAARSGLFSKELRSELRSERLKGKLLSAKTVAKRSRHMAETWADPAIRAERVERRRKACARPEVRRQIAEATRAAIRARRGGFEPATAAEAAEFAFLTRTKKIPAAEAGRMIRASQPKATGGR